MAASKAGSMAEKWVVTTVVNWAAMMAAPTAGSKVEQWVALTVGNWAQRTAAQMAEQWVVLLAVK